MLCSAQDARTCSRAPAPSHSPRLRSAPECVHSPRLQQQRVLAWQGAALRWPSGLCCALGAPGRPSSSKEEQGHASQSLACTCVRSVQAARCVRSTDLLNAVVCVYTRAPKQRAQLRHAQRIQPVRHGRGPSSPRGQGFCSERPASKERSCHTPRRRWRARRQTRSCWMWAMRMRMRRLRRPRRVRKRPRVVEGGRGVSASARAPARRATAAAAL
jgi:hypothetical protein